MREFLFATYVAGQALLQPAVQDARVPRASEIQESVDRAYERSIRQAEDYAQSVSRQAAAAASAAAAPVQGALGQVSPYGLQGLDDVPAPPPYGAVLYGDEAYGQGGLPDSYGVNDVGELVRADRYGDYVDGPYEQEGLSDGLNADGLNADGVDARGELVEAERDSDFMQLASPLGTQLEAGKPSTFVDIIETLVSSNFNITESVQKLAASGIDLNSIIKDSVTGKPSVDALIKNISSSDIDVNSFVQRLADSGLDFNKLVDQIANSPISIDKIFQNLYNGGVDFNKMVKDIDKSGVDIDDSIKKLNESGIDPSIMIESPALAAIINSGALANPHLTDMLDVLAKQR